MLRTKRKGITPVIAIVLLLLVTVGAVGVVYTQFQELVEDPDTDFLDDAEIEIMTVSREGDDPGTMELRLQNQDDAEYNLSEVARVEYSVPGEGSQEPFSAVEDYDELSSELDLLDDDPECFTAEAEDEIQNFGPGDTATCDTGIDMVNPNDEVTIHLMDDGSGEEIDSYTCSPSTSESSTC